jgi:hypothetical protein
MEANVLVKGTGQEKKQEKVKKKQEKVKKRQENQDVIRKKRPCDNFSILIIFCYDN